MNNKNKLVQPFIMVFSTVVVLLVLSFVNTQTNFFEFKTKKINLLEDVVLKGVAKQVPLPQVILNDSIISKDSIDFAKRKADVASIFDFEEDTTSALSHFFKSLNETRKKKHKTRIAYFGDSMIEGDLISQDLRNDLQDVFGGNGVGFVPITSIVAGFRTSIIHQFGDWTTYNLLSETSKNHSLGISGYCFVPTDSSASWVKYVAVNKKHINKFYETKLLFGKCSDENFVQINGENYKLKGTNSVNELVIKYQNPCQSINAKFKCKTPIDIFGFSMESDSGVFVDNFSFRGNSGMPLCKIPQRVYSETNNCLNYDLIILEYGLNVVNSTVTNFSWYEHAMNNTIKYLQTAFPQTSILLISVGDKSYEEDGVFKTDPSVPLLVETQKRMAKNNKLAFLSLYDAMGGNGSMVKWVEGDTVLANKDYTHFNFKGAHKVGNLLFQKLMSEYNDYNKKHN